MTESRALGWLPHTCFLTGPPRRTGVEVEHVLLPTAQPSAHAPTSHERSLFDAVYELPLTCRVTIEPGGQLELSSPPATDVSQAVTVVRHDLEQVRRLAAGHGLRLAGVGLDPHRRSRRVLDSPRYAAMEEYFDATGGAGRVMMCSTASVQVCVEARPVAATGAVATMPDLDLRWKVLHDAGPALVAAFANSPLCRGRPTGWMSTRQMVWTTLDPYRTRAPRLREGESIADAWARWVLDAPLLLVRRVGAPWRAPRGVTFRDWIRAGHRAVPDRPAPSWDDLAYHLTTLFPPVRARGHLEVRYLDAQPDDWWTVPVAVVTALVDHPAVAEAALDACAGTRTRWLDAARLGLRDADLANAATQVLTLAAASLRASAATADLAAHVEAYLERWTLRGRSPADDLLDDLPTAQASPLPLAPGTAR